MNIVFAIHNPSLVRAFEKTFRYLSNHGHQVKVLYGRYDKPHIVGRALRTCQSELSNFESLPMLFRKKWLRLSNIRELINYANYFRSQHPTPWEARRWLGNISRRIKKKVKKSEIGNKLLSEIDNKLLAREKILSTLKLIEHVIPPDKDILLWLKANQPDVVVASPFILPFSPEIEYIKAADALGIPTVAVVLSWDNLTTKGTFHIIPDTTFVWNDALAEEATILHDIPHDKIFITGAPVFDFWFEVQPKMNFDSFAKKVGIGAHQPYVLYLCSSKYISGDETSFVRAFAAVLRENPHTAHLRVLVRPHPLNATIWDGFEDQNIAIWPKDPSWVDTAAAKQDYCNSLYHSSAVIGLNTSAFLEAAILDKPCVTIITDQYRSKQTGLGHFQHLLRGDFLEVTHSLRESASVIASILSGEDDKKEQRLRFIRDFIRPHGLDKSASEIMAKAIEYAALRKDIQRYSYN
jgi:hypothetical protein